ncbi:hypothetical protein RI129_000817 [Pyrocoelia pectoralis]|uniref:Peptidase S1 domain-containing protein n=1 Tax=Pyrocoelia pectoralis TaxID=417401 RepID=A0AAN7VTW3_9COLE
MVCCGSVSSYKENYVSNLPHENVCGIWNPSTNEDIPPWVGMIEVSNSREICVGALINYQYVISTSICTGRDAKRLNIKFGQCITHDSRKSECHFKVKQVKLFPLHNYLHSEDTGIVLLKLARTTTKFNRIPICLPQDQLAVRQRVNLMGLERSSYSEWTGNDISGSALFNDDCNFEADLKYLCFKSENMHFVPYQYILSKFDDNQWYLEGIFNWKEWNGSPSRNMYAIYVYKFTSWIKSNIS